MLYHLELSDLRAGQLAAVREQLSALGGRLHLAAAESAGISRRRVGLCRARIPDLVRAVHYLRAVRYAAAPTEVVHDCRLDDGHMPFGGDIAEQVPARQGMV